MACKTCENAASSLPAQSDGEHSTTKTREVKWSSLQQTAMMGCNSCRIIWSTIIAGTPLKCTIMFVETVTQDGTFAIHVSYTVAGRSLGVDEYLYPFSEQGKCC
jgi:hypothetical protein